MNDTLKTLQAMYKTTLDQLIMVQSLEWSAEKDTIKTNLIKCNENINSLILKEITNETDDES